MWRRIRVLWACPLAAVSCTVSVPDVTIIQSAYDREASAGTNLHDKGLRVLAVTCDPRTGSPYLCQITFTSQDDPAQRLYFDIVAVEATPDGWELRSGLCKR